VIIVVYIVAIVIVFGAFWKPLDLDTSFAGFARADGESMQQRDAFLLALTEQDGLGRRRRLEEDQEILPAAPAAELGAGGRRLSEVAHFVKRSLIIIYSPKAQNAFDERVLSEIRDFEQRLRSLEGWRYFCHDRIIDESERWLCDPGESVAAIAYPTQVQDNDTAESPGVSYKLRFDGRGEEPFRTTSLLQYMGYSYLRLGDESRNLRRYFPRDFSDAWQNSQTMVPRPVAIRSRFTFMINFGLVSWPMQQVRQEAHRVKEQYEQFISDEVYPLLRSTAEDYEHTDIYYTGDHIVGIEVEQTLMSDILWVIGCLAFVTAYMWFHIRSLLISLGCFFIIFASVPMAYVMAPAARTTIASFLSLFLVTVIDIDVVYIFIDFWDQSGHLKSTEQRLVWMLLRGGASCLATSLTTSLSFFANLASCLQPLREFGLFMGLSVMAVYFLALMFLPPLIAIRERGRERVKRRVVDISQGDSSLLQVQSPSDPGCCCLPCCPGTPARRQDSCIFIALAYLVHKTSHCAASVVCITALCMPLFVTGVVLGFRFDQGAPEIFPEGHNQVEYGQLLPVFASVVTMDDIANYSPDRQPAEEGNVCDATYFDTNPRCVLEQCHATPILHSQDPGNAICVRSPTFVRQSDTLPRVAQGFSTQACNWVNLAGKMVTDQARVSLGAWDAMWRSIMFDAANKSGPQESFWASLGNPTARPVARAPMALEVWETGEVNMTSLFNVRTVNAHVNSHQPDTCEIDIMCFFTAQRCELPGWQEMPQQYTPEQSWRRLDELSEPLAEATALAPLFGQAPTRSLQGVNVVASTRIDIAVVWGIRALQSRPLVGAPPEEWSFDPTFLPSNPWGQRAVFRMCTDMPDDLYIIGSGDPDNQGPQCWAQDFRQWLRDRNRQFPSRDFDSDLLDWYGWQQRTGLDVAQKSLWMQGETVIACRVLFYANVNKLASSAIIQNYKKSWDNWVNSRNSEASMSGNRAWHTAEAWVRAEAEEAIISSTTNTILIELGCSFAGLLIFTGDLILAALVVCMVIVNISGLAFFMVFIMNWAVGPIEVISLVIFVGFSVTYGLHMAHAYSRIGEDDPALLRTEEWVKRHWGPRRGRRKEEAVQPGADAERGDIAEERAMLERTPYELRVARTRMAVLKVGGAIISSTVSTIGSSLFLLGCTLTIFLKLGLVVIVVTTLSIFFTLVALPAVMMLLGPSRDPCYKRIPRQLFGRLLAILGFDAYVMAEGSPASSKKGAGQDDNEKEELLAEAADNEVLS
jgi:hypothetical protein